MKFRYYIQDPYRGAIYGTDDDAEAINMSNCDDYFVVDSYTGEWLNYSGERLPVEPFIDVDETPND